MIREVVRSPAFDRLLEDPTDAAAIRVWGDALLADGEVQGEAIQLACSLEAMALAAPKRRAIERRLGELVEQYERVWSAALLESIPIAAQRWPQPVLTKLVRGVAAHLEGPCDKLVEFLDDAARVAPIVSLTPYLHDKGTLARLAACPAFTRIGRLQLTGAWVNAELVFESAVTPALEVLALGAVGPPVIESLARCGRLDRLIHLAIRASEGITPELIGPLLRRVGPQLARLELEGVKLGASGVALIRDTCPALRELAVEECGIDRHAARTLADGAWPALERLAIGGNPLGGDGIVAIASAKSLAKLTHLSLKRRPNTPSFDAKQLARMLDKLAMPKLVALDLDHCLIRAAGATALALANKLPKLEHLSLRGAGLGVNGAAALAKGTWSALRRVVLDGNQMTTPALQALAGAPWLASVEHLSLVDNDFKTGGGKALAASRYLKSLRVLELGNNWLGSQGIAALLRDSLLPTTLEDIHTRPGTGNNYGAAILEGFVASEDLTLRYLDCHEATPDQLATLWSCPRARSLRRITVPAGSLDDTCAKRLAASPHLPNLGLLEIRGVPLASARAILAERFGPRLSAHPA